MPIEADAPPRISLRTLGVICGTATELHTHCPLALSSSGGLLLRWGVCAYARTQETPIVVENLIEDTDVRFTVRPPSGPITPCAPIDLTARSIWKRSAGRASMRALFHANPEFRDSQHR